MTKPKTDPEREALNKEKESLTKRIDDLEQKLRYTNYELSQEYKDTYETPLHEIFARGRERAANMKAFMPGEVDEVTGVEGPAKLRQGTKEDFDRLLSIADDDQAADYAAKVWGNKAAAVWGFRERFIELNGKRIKALEEFKAKGADMQKQSLEASAAQDKEMETAFEAENKAAVEKYPQWFKAEDGDEEGKKALEEGFQFADSAFNGKFLATLPPAQKAKVFSALRNKAAGFDYAVVQNVRLRKRLNELQEKLKGYEESGDGGGDKDRKGKKEVAGLSAADAAIDRMAGMNQGNL